MVGEGRPRLWLFVGLVLASGLLAYAAAAPSEKPTKTPDDRVLFPPNEAVLMSGSFDVICRPGNGELEVDGRPREWDPFQPVRVAHLRLPPGMHELRIGRMRREFVVALNEEEHDGPPDWPIHQRHPMNSDEDRCADCHETDEKDGRMIVGELRDNEACFACHPSADVEAAHSHPVEPTEHCERCHALHGSARKGLLKAPAKQLWEEYHASLGATEK